MQLKSYAVKSHQGPYLNVNEDDQECDLINGLFFIMDGIGGSGIGDQCVRQLKEDIKNFYIKVSGDPESTLPFYFSHKFLIEGNALINALHSAHKKLFDKNKSLDISLRGGASGIFSSMAENIMTILSTGNCRIYLFRGGHLEQLFVEDSLVSVSQDRENFHLRTCPLSGLGIFEQLHYQIREIKIQKNDLLCFLTDGVYSRIDFKELEFVLMKQDDYLMKKIDELFELSNKRGNLDNQTTLLLQF